VGLAALAAGLVLLWFRWPLGVAALALAAVCVLGSVRGWRFPGTPPPPDPLEGLSRKARRYVRVDPEWSVDFLPPAMGHRVPQPVPFSGFQPGPTSFGAIPLRHARREPGDLEAVGAELAFFRDDGALVHERVPARWSRNPFPELRAQLVPEVRRLPASGEEEPIEVVARIDDEQAAYVHTAEATRGGRRLPLPPGGYHVRVRLTGTPDEPVAWYRLSVPLMAGLDLGGPVDEPSWAPRPKRRRSTAPRARPRKRGGSAAA
jgi:hypothetical protein